MPALRSDRSRDEEPLRASLPYDPEEWEQRLAAARAQREKVLKGRAAGEQRQDLVAGPEPTPAKAGQLLRLTNPASEPPEAAPPKSSGRIAETIRTAFVASGARAATAARQMAPYPPRRAGQLRPALFGLVLGAVAGTALTSVGFQGGIGALQSRLISPVAAPQSPYPDDAPVHEATAPLAPALAPPRSRAPRPLHPVTAEVNAAAPVPLAAPAMPAASSPAIPAIVLATGSLPPVASPAKSQQLPSPGPQPEVLPASRGLPRARGEPFISISPPSLVIPEATHVPAHAGGATSSPQRQVPRVTVHAPEQMQPDRRRSALESLSENGWSTETAESSPHTISKTHVRYYHPEDRTAARELADLFDAAARDFTSYSPSPNEGLLELWLSGQGAPRQARPVRTRAVADRTTPSAPGFLSRIVDALEGGSADGRGGNRRSGSGGGSFSASRGGGAASASRPAAVDGGAGAGRPSAGADGNDRSAGTAANSSSPSRGGSNERSGSRSSSGDHASSAAPGRDEGRGNGGGRGNGKDRGNGGNRGGGAAENSSGGKGHGASSSGGKGHGASSGGGGGKGHGASSGGGGKGHGASNGRGSDKGGGRSGNSNRGGKGNGGGGGKGGRGG